MRATASVLPPAANGTMSLIGRLGHRSCAWSGAVQASVAMTAKSSFLIFVSPKFPDQRTCINPALGSNAMPHQSYPLDVSGLGYVIVMLGVSFATDTLRRTVIAPLAQHRRDFG